MSSAGMETPVCTASGMRHWREMNQIASNTDYYFCYIIKLSCLPPACYHFSAPVITMDILVCWTVLPWRTPGILLCIQWEYQACRLFNHSLVQVIIPGIVIRMSPAGVRTPVWIASDIGHWQGMTKITNDTDYYWLYNCSALSATYLKWYLYYWISWLACLNHNTIIIKY